jgi:hypothetical protein
MGFPTGTTAIHEFQEGQRRFLLGQAMDLNSIVWIIGIYLTAQERMDDQLLPLRAENNGQGVIEPQSKDHIEVNDTEGLFFSNNMLRKRFEPNLFFRLWAQDFGKLEAHKMFPLLFLGDTSYVDSYLDTQTDCSGEDMHLDSSADDGGKGVALSMD